MADKQIPHGELESVRDAVRAWAHACGEDHPRNVQVVYTTRSAATELLHPGATADPQPCYFVTLEGGFDLPLTPEAPRRTGSWAALYINAETMQVSSLTVRPHEYVPSHLPLDELGQVYTINFG
ncbi:hypothetical protein AB0H73_01240 [Streptomyces olivoreticuli]